VPSDAAGTNWRMFHGDFRDRLADLPDGSVDLIITDPPYPAEFMHLWSHLSEQSRRVLKPQGILVALTGAIMLPEVMSKLGEHLQWGWMYVQPLPGANSRIMGRHVLQAYKPWLAYSVGPWPSGSIDWHPDMLDASSRAKDRYRWEQDPNPTKMLIDALSPEGGTVLDPFTGTGSYGIAALQMGRKFIGVESDADRFQKASERLAGHE
jgi:16S rRNA G966 N2-methylase RsmD